jgi:hypothetical protein
MNPTPATSLADQGQQFAGQLLPLIGQFGWGGDIMGAAVCGTGRGAGNPYLRGVFQKRLFGTPHHALECGEQIELRRHFDRPASGDSAGLKGAG